MIRAMLDATGRLSAVGRQASDVALWVSPTPVAGEVALVTLAEKAATLVPSGGVAVRLDEASGRQTISTSDAEALAAALAALADLTARDTGGRVELQAGGAGDGHTVTLTVTPVEADPPEAGLDPKFAAALAARPVTLAFDRGGFGLSLVLASYVLDAHGATVRAGDFTGSVDIRLQKAGGST